MQHRQTVSPPGSIERVQTGDVAPGTRNVRVFSIAQKYEQQSQDAVPSGRNRAEGSAIDPRPRHTHRQSLPILPSTGSHAKLQEAAPASEDLSSTRAWVASHRGRHSIESPVEGRSTLFEEEAPHPSICACEVCSLKGYDTTQALDGGEGDAWGRINNETTMRSTRSAGSRRVSMPVAIRGTATR